MRRVEIGCHYDRWMMGDRLGVVVRYSKRKRDGKTIAHVKMDRSGKTVKVLDEDNKYL